MAARAMPKSSNQTFESSGRVDYALAKERRDRIGSGIRISQKATQARVPSRPGGHRRSVPFWESTSKRMRGWLLRSFYAVTIVSASRRVQFNYSVPIRIPCDGDLCTLIAFAQFGCKRQTNRLLTRGERVRRCLKSAERRGAR